MSKLLAKRAIVERGISVSNCGTIVTRSDGFVYKLFTNRRSPRFKGYKAIRCFKSGNVDVHHLVAISKFGDLLFEGDTVVRHLNGDSFDNSFDNIAIGSRTDNNLDVPQSHRIAHATYAASFKRRFSDEEIRTIRRDNKSGISLNDLSARYTCSKSTLSYIINRKTYAGVF